MADNVTEEPSEDLVANAKREAAARRNPFAKLVLFFKQVMGELKKVVTPTRRELLNYTGVVLVFVIIMMLFIFGLDQFYGWLITAVFGDSAA